MKRLLYLMAALMLLAACASKEGEYAEPRFRKIEHRDFTILGEELMLSVVGSEAAWQDHLILLPKLDPALKEKITDP